MHLVENLAHDELELLVPLHAKRQRSRVRFQDCAVEIWSQSSVRSELSIDEIRSRWYSRSDFQRFKQTAQLICKESQASPLVGLLRDRYCSAQHRLDLWVIHGRSLRGLEYMITREHCDQHRMSRRNHHLAVLDAQDVSRRTGVGSAAMLAKIAIASSNQAREFATRMGIADSRALLQDLQSPTVLPARRQSSYLPRPGRSTCFSEWSRRPSQIIHTSVQPSKPCV